MRVLALSGSLRTSSINTALLRALAQMAAPKMQFEVCDLIGHLPLFNPDLENYLPRVVSDLHAKIRSADVLVIASPEYAHGVTGVIKNALDWCVSFEGFVNKPVAILQARARSQFADAALRETLKTMSAQILEEASLTFPLNKECFTTETMLQTPEVLATIQRCLQALLVVDENAVGQV